MPRPANGLLLLAGLAGAAVLLVGVGQSLSTATIRPGGPSSSTASPIGPAWPYRGWSLADLRSENASPVQRANLAVLVDRVLVPLQTIYGVRATVTSGARSVDKNDEVDGSPTSGHLAGEALDLKVPGWSAWRLAEAIRGLVPSFDQIIAYATSRGGHVHVGLRVTTPGAPRRMIMVAPAGSTAELVSPATYDALQFQPDTGIVA